MENNDPQESQDMRLKVISDYNFDELETKAYKMCLIWLDRSRKIFPEYKHTPMKQGDPRKSLIFKLCYKFARETAGILEEKDYNLYVRAQLEVLKHINACNGKALIDINCLVGDKAWKRWKLWKRKYDAVSAKPTEISQAVGPGEIKAIDGLERTKEFISKTFGATPDLEKYREAYINKNLFRWINFGKISPYYLTISPHIQKLLSPEDFKKLNFDVDLYKPCITENVKKKFREIFAHENLPSDTIENNIKEPIIDFDYLK